MIEIIQTDNYKLKLRASIQSTGRLGFTEETIKSLELCEGKYVRFGKEGNMFYMSIHNSEVENSFPVIKYGKYFYISTKLMFDDQKIDYKSKTILFDLARYTDGDTVMGGATYRMEMRILDKKRKEAAMS